MGQNAGERVKIGSYSVVREGENIKNNKTNPFPGNSKGARIIQ
jgi:hypothetical protein